MSSNEASVIVNGAGRGILVHVGIDTVKLAGEGLTTLAQKGDWVEAGSHIMRMDPALAAGYSLVGPVVVLDSKPDTVAAMAGGEVRAGDWRSPCRLGRRQPSEAKEAHSNESRISLVVGITGPRLASLGAVGCHASALDQVGPDPGLYWC